MKLTDKQKKALMIAGVVLGIIHYAPSIVSAVRERREAYRAAHEKPSPVPAPVHASSAPPPPVVAAPPAPLASPDAVMDAQVAAAVGPSSIWGGFVPRPNLGPCQLKISLTAGAYTGSYSADSSLSCANLSPFRPGQRSTISGINNAQLDAVPVNAELAGMVKDGAIVLTQIKALNFTRQGCNIAKIVLTPFAGHLDATWEEGPKDTGAVNHCGGEHVTLSRAKTF